MKMHSVAVTAGGIQRVYSRCDCGPSAEGFDISLRSVAHCTGGALHPLLSLFLIYGPVTICLSQAGLHQLLLVGFPYKQSQRVTKADSFFKSSLLD